MSVIRYEPWTLMNRVHGDLDRLFATRVANGDETRRLVTSWVPAVDIKEDEKQFSLRADVPGVEPKNIDITMEDGVLTLRGERVDEKDTENEGFRRVERVSGKFHRRFSMPDTADSTAISASYTNGVLEVLIPKQAKAQPRRIEVNAA